MYIEHGFSTAGMAPPTRPHILIIVENLPVPLDRRVWLECQALVRSGYEVSVICPKGPGDPARQQIDGVHIYKYRPAPEAAGLAGFAAGIHLQLVAHGVAVAGRLAAAALPGHPGLQSAGYLLAARATLAVTGSEVCVRPA